MGAGAGTTRKASVSRRGLLAGAGAVSLASVLPADARAPLALDRFMRMSERLCGVTLASTTFGKDVLALLSQEFSAAQLRALAHLVEARADRRPDFSAAGLRPLVSRLVSVWYSGLAATPAGGERALSYMDAAAWAATGYAKPPTSCADFGDWARAPDLSRTAR